MLYVYVCRGARLQAYSLLYDPVIDKIDNK